MQESIEEMEMVLALANLAKTNRIMLLDAVTNNMVDASQFTDKELIDKILKDELLFQTVKYN